MADTASNTKENAGAADTLGVVDIESVHNPEVLLSQRSLKYCNDHNELTLIARVNCPKFCDLRGTIVHITGTNGDDFDLPLTAFNGVENETEEFVVSTGSAKGSYCWTATYSAKAGEQIITNGIKPVGSSTKNTDGSAINSTAKLAANNAADSTANNETLKNDHSEASFSAAFDFTPHTISASVWDMPFPAVRQNRVAVKVGAKCTNNCDLSDAVVQITDSTGTALANGTLNNQPQAGMPALYWASFSFAAPDKTGTHTYNVTIKDVSEHQPATSSFSLFVVNEPQHTLTVTVIDKDTKYPIEGARVYIHPYTEFTDKNGVAIIHTETVRSNLIVKYDNYFTETIYLAVASDTHMPIELKEKPENLGDF